jgi:hypothetical protein
MTNYPIGATWKAIADNGKVGEIRLISRGNYIERWDWIVRYSDGTIDRTDWNPSYRMCREEIPLYNQLTRTRIRFIRTQV